jgi:hypothetical protein
MYFCCHICQVADDLDTNAGIPSMQLWHFYHKSCKQNAYQPFHFVDITTLLSEVTKGKGKAIPVTGHEGP